MANEKTPVVWDDTTSKHRPLGTGEKMGGLDASSLLSSDSGNLLEAGSDGLAYLSGSGVVDPRADNLLEDSANGKLQVTIDRIAEWLDGHPQDAAALAEAIHVVSGDEGNIIAEGSDKGAYLSNAQLAAAFAGLSDAQKAAIAAAVAGKMAAQLADGKTIVASNGKLTSDPTNATAAQKAAINGALADADSGLVVDPSTGKLQVDFSNMPTDKFEELLKGLKMFVPLSSNKTLYVSVNNSAAGDDLIDGRGTAAKPFKTIQACVNYATGNYSVGNYHITIRVVAGTYPENVTLPDFSHGTGYIEIVADSGARDVIVQAQLNSVGTRGTCFTATGGQWRLYHMDARRVENPTLGAGPTPGCYHAENDGTHLQLLGCAAAQTMPSSSPLGGNDYSVRLIEADSGARIDFDHGSVAGSISTQKPASGTPRISVLVAERGGSLYLIRRSASDSLNANIACSGSCDVFLDLWQNGVVNTLGSGNTLVSFTGTVSGKRYSLTGGSYVAGNLGATYFPGDEAGTVQASTYCWYSGVDPA